MIADPPVEEGADQEMTDCVFSFEVADTPVGAPGTVLGVPLVAEEAVPEPALFTARIFTL